MSERAPNQNSEPDFWTDEPEETVGARDDAMVDSIFRIRCRGLPADHADALRAALCEVLPWLEADAGVAIIPVLGAASGNGWMRPQGGDSFIHMSRRAFFSLRLPRGRADEARRLEGMELRVGDEVVGVAHNKVRPLLGHSTLFARQVALPEAEDETAFLTAVAARLRAMDVKAGKIMGGQCAGIRIASKRVPARGVLVAGLSPTESLKLQTLGIGDRMTWGCGVFLPHKGVAAVGSRREQYAAR